MATRVELDSDLQKLLNDTDDFTKGYNNMKKSLRDLRLAVSTLSQVDTNRRAREKELSKHNDLYRNIMSNQQNILATLASDKLELLKEQDTFKDKLTTLTDAEEKYQQEVNELKASIECLKAEHATQLQAVRNEADEKVQNTIIELEVSKADTSYSVCELERQLRELKDKSDEKINLLTLNYENQLRVATEQSSNRRSELQTLQESKMQCAALYRKKVQELEIKNRELESKLREFEKKLQEKESAKPVTGFPIPTFPNVTPRTIRKLVKNDHGSVDLTNEAPKSVATDRTPFAVTKKRKLFTMGTCFDDN